MRKQFTFYGSFYEAVSVIKDPEVRLQAYDAICSYALTGEDPDIDALADAAAIAFIMAKPNLDASKQKAEAGKRGGNASTVEADAKQTEADAKQTASKAEQSASKKESENEGEKESESKNECYSPPTPSLDDCGFSPELESAVSDWLAYKRERRENYKPIGLKSLLTQIQKAAAEHGDAAVVDIIGKSMANGYQGIVFDRLKKGGAPGGTRGTVAEGAKPKRNWGITYDV